jgi:hypothetical protein
MGQRFVASYQILDCQGLLNIPDPVSVTVDGNGVTTAVTIDSSSLGRWRPFLRRWDSNDGWWDDARRAAAATE